MKFLNTIFTILVSLPLLGQGSIPTDRLMSDGEVLAAYKGAQELKDIHALTAYFKETYASRYYFSWKEFDKRFVHYNEKYSGRKKNHQDKANSHLELYNGSTTWKLPFKNLKGKDVSSYELRHLARQQKSPDIALLHYFTKDEKYVRYFVDQVASLNASLEKGEYETIEDGNGVYEVYRGGHRMLNWLRVHAFYLASESYTDADQLMLIKTFLQTASFLYHENQKFKSGNHQTRGMAALAMISILFSDFEDAKLWYEHSMKILGMHLEKEINKDGFQFERTVHYHISDIDNYFYVYQLLQRNDYEIPPIWQTQLKGMFDALLMISKDNKTAPVLSDDTKEPLEEYNSLKNIMTTGWLLFKDKRYGYLAADKVSSSDYWYFTLPELNGLMLMKTERPTLSSFEFPQTGYYIMRAEENDAFMIINSGLAPKKNDHQHGDILGFSAYTYGKEILPNYQVRYSYEDFQFFKSSWVKNVALVDSVPQGGEWVGNKGGSGFGKWGDLPIPKKTGWYSSDILDVFEGTHVGFEEMNTDYFRKIFFFKKDAFWLVIDKFESEEKHTYQQIWQGDFDEKKSLSHLRRNLGDGKGLDIVQLGEKPLGRSTWEKREKAASILQFEGKAGITELVTLVHPYEFSGNSIKPKEKYTGIKIAGWAYEISESGQIKLIQHIAAKAESAFLQKDKALLLKVTSIEGKNGHLTFSKPVDVLVVEKGKKLSMTLLSTGETIQTQIGKNIQQLNFGDTVELDF
ncbi:heparinase II/III family protein [Flammeovirgaceae bacterium SG7u.111]|nr:heparinase II/III family protein [Flammeovirgaceae bacterium SG7u.132]WPO33229.1 heparinase II/III family protein [Flammeovirgaceae bacterium SG7u.111]